MPADPAPVPEWAISMAINHANEYYDAGDAFTLARLLASVREGAIRQCRDAIVALPWESDDNGNAVTLVDGAYEAINALLHTPPSGGA